MAQQLLAEENIYELERLWVTVHFSLFIAVTCHLSLVTRHSYAVKLLPQPHPPVALGLLKVNPLPCIEEV